MKLSSKIALITGASKGIGAATAIALAKEGCSVIINYKKDSRAAQAVLKKCNLYSSGNILIQADITKSEEVEDMFRLIRKKYPKLHILINNAGSFDEHDSPTNIKTFESLLNSNFLAHTMVTTHALKLLKRGKIINVSSIHGTLGFGRPSATAYAASKAALESYTKNLAKHLAPNILVNAVAPGRVMTPMWGKQSVSQKKKLGEVHLIKRMVEPDEVADAILFLLKNDAMCAEILAIDGGYKIGDIR